VKCLNEHGEINAFPITYTNLHTRDESVIGNGCAMTIKNLLSLKELLDSIICSGEVQTKLRRMCKVKYDAI